MCLSWIVTHKNEAKLGNSKASLDCRKLSWWTLQKHHLLLKKCLLPLLPLLPLRSFGLSLGQGHSWTFITLSHCITSNVLAKYVLSLEKHPRNKFTKTFFTFTPHFESIWRLESLKCAHTLNSCGGPFVRSLRIRKNYCLSTRGLINISFHRPTELRRNRIDQCSTVYMYLAVWVTCKLLWVNKWPWKKFSHWVEVTWWFYIEFPIVLGIPPCYRPFFTNWFFTHGQTSSGKIMFLNTSSIH